MERSRRYPPRLFPPHRPSLYLFRLKPCWLFMTLVAAVTASVSVHGEEYYLSDRPLPGEAKEKIHPVDAALVAPKKEEKPVILRGIKDQLKTAPPAVRDADFRRENQDDSRNEAWAAGGELAMDTGKIAGIAQIGLSYYFSVGLRKPSDKLGSGLLDDNQDNLYTLGRAFLQIGESKMLEARLFRQVFHLPYINTDVGRMIPRTHEAYLLRRTGTNFDFGAGHFTKTKAQGD